VANWSSGNFQFPTSTGSFSITGLVFRPQGLFFICSNIGTLDTPVSTSYPTLGFGMSWIDKDTGLPDSQAVTNVMTGGINVKPNPIVMTDSLGCVEEYAASLTSFNSDGFTLNVTNAAPSTRWVTWMAYGGFENAGGSANLSSGFYTLGYQILTAFAMNYRTSSGIRNGCETARYTSLYIGANSQPRDLSAGSWGSGGTSYFPITGTQGFTRNDFNINPPPQFQSAINISTGDFPPIVLEDRIQLWRQDAVSIGAGVGGGPLRWMAQWWTGENWSNSFQPALAVGNTSTFSSGNPALTKIEAGIYTGLLGDEAEGLGAKSRMSIGFITEDGQGVVGANQDGYAFQSTSMFCLPNLDSGNAHASSGVISNGDIVATTEINDGYTDTYSGGIFSWGPAPGGWIPQIYRRWPY
jgi:hypothetical protein